MKLVALILIMISLSGQCFLQLGILNWYQLNKEAITQNYCENKDKPATKCQGKCYLKKQLKKAENQQQEEKTIVKQADWPLFILPLLLQSEDRSIYDHRDDQFPLFNEAYHFGYTAYIFHPPDVA
jgi:hypothetical protein